MADETKQVDVIMGPYRGSRLTMTAADADAAVNGHWAANPVVTHDPDQEPHPPLSDQERADAMAAAVAWAQATWHAAQGTEPPEPPPEGGAQKRAMKPEEAEGYKTREIHQTAPHKRP